MTNVALPLNLVTLNFVASVAAPQTAVNVTASGTASGFTFEGTPAAIGAVIQPTATSQTIAEADGALVGVTPNLVIIDVADPADYAAGRITGAKTLAEVDLASLAKDTPILVYCRDAENAKAEANKLAAAPNSFTRVYYLYDTFANWVAAVNSDEVEYKLTLTIAGTGNGIIVDGAGNQYALETWYAKDAVVKLTGKPDAGSKFDGFSVDATGTAPVDLTMNASKAVTATFSPTGCTAAFTATAGATTVTAPTGITINKDDAVTFDISASANYSSFVLSYGDGAEYAGPNKTATHTFTASSPVTLTLKDASDAVCSTQSMVVTVNVPGVTYTVTATAGANGSISPSGTVEVNEGEAKTFTITPSNDYLIEDVKVDSVSQGAVTSYTFPSTTTGTHTISATFKVKPVGKYTVTATAGANGSISPSGTVEVNVGQAQTFVITPSNGYLIDDVKVDGASQGSVASYTFLATTTGTHTIFATFKTIAVNKYTVTATAGANGSISPSGTVEVNEGQSQLFIITPYNGYVVEDVNVDGVSKGTVTSYTFPSTTTGTHTISVTFIEEGVVTSNGDGNCDNYTDIYDALLAAIIGIGNPGGVAVCNEDMLDVIAPTGVDINDALAIAKYDVGLTCNCILDAKK